MVKVVLPKMLEKKKGVIVNLSSFFGSLRPPMMIVYGATKVNFIAVLNCVPIATLSLPLSLSPSLPLSLSLLSHTLKH